MSIVTMCVRNDNDDHNNVDATRQCSHEMNNKYCNDYFMARKCMGRLLINRRQKALSPYHSSKKQCLLP
eukprot:scaffold192973_cov21-Prasinocladus_malaysianus.AAC.1